MIKQKSTLLVLLISSVLALFSGCGLMQQKEETQKSDAINSEAVAQIQIEKKALLEKANAELAAINKKIMACNDKMNARKVKLTDAQNKALDEFENQRASINQRIHEIKNVKFEDWNDFKNKFESDLSEASSNLDKIMAEL